MAVTKQDRAEFRAFVVNATNRQLEAIIEKEDEASRYDRDRRVYYNIAVAERERREW